MLSFSDEMSISASHENSPKGQLVATLFSKVIRAQAFISRFSKMGPFTKKCQKPLDAQWEYLKWLLKRHEDTAFGRKYDFKNIKSIKEYQQKVPIHRWDDIAPYIERVKEGELTALFPANEKLIMFATTSGTSGIPKFVPVTETSYKLWNNTWAHTWSNVMRESPATFDGKGLYFPGDPEEGFINNIPHGAITAKAYAAQSAVIRTIYPYPFQVSRIKNYNARYYTIMRMALEQDISFIPIANPSVALALFNTAQVDRKNLIEDIRTGNLSHENLLPPELVKMLRKKIKPNPKKAQFLQDIYDVTGDFLPRDYWPNLKTMICFSGGSCRLYLKRVQEYIGDTQVFDFGLLSSEARLSFPISSKHRGGVLTIESNFFEFIPEAQIDLPHPEILTLDQLEKGSRYFVLFTNASGLYRYNISDLVEVIGFHGNTPIISFCNKGSSISSLTGEKLTEMQIVESVRKASAKTGYDVTQFVACPHWDEKLPHYTILRDERADDNREQLQEFINCVEAELQEQNMEYSSKRSSQRLAPLTLKIVKSGGLHAYQEAKKNKCRNLSQFKYVYLNPDHQFEAQFEIQNVIVAAAISQHVAAA